MSGPIVRRVLLVFALAALSCGVAAQKKTYPSPAAERPADLKPATGGFLQYFLDTYPIKTQKYQVWLAQDYELHFGRFFYNGVTRNRAEFQDDARWLLATWLGCDLKHVRFSETKSPTPSPTSGDARTYFELFVDQPVGVTVALELKKDSPSWLFGPALDPQPWFVQKWGIGVMPCSSAADTTATDLGGQMQLCNWVEKMGDLTPIPSGSAPSPSPSVQFPSDPETSSEESSLEISEATDDSAPVSAAPVETPAPSPSPPPMSIPLVIPLPVRVTFPPGFLPIKYPSPAAKKSRKLLARDEHDATLTAPQQHIFELFSTPMTHAEAVTFCAARGSMMVEYTTLTAEGMHVVDGLCSQAAPAGSMDAQCWVAGMAQQELCPCASSTDGLAMRSCKAHLPVMCWRTASSGL